MQHLELVAEVLEPGFEDARLGVDVGDAEHEDGAAQVVVEIDALRDFAARHRQQSGPAAVVARADVVLQRQARLGRVLITTNPSKPSSHPEPTKHCQSCVSLRTVGQCSKLGSKVEYKVTFTKLDLTKSP